MHAPLRDKKRIPDEFLFQNLTSFGELEKRLLALDEPERQKKAFALFAEGFLTLRPLPRAQEVLPIAHLNDLHYHRRALPHPLPGADGFLFLADHGCHPYHLLFHPPPPPPPLGTRNGPTSNP
ncbi:MAG: hypothetical protein HQL76_16715 [Magnetococcales bacterium]|nr:hypothetical protein [Magnetococcales bacterium]